MSTGETETWGFESKSLEEQTNKGDCRGGDFDIALEEVLGKMQDTGRSR
jgi:hypothetical protein